MVSGKQSLEGRVAVITGGGTGLGKATALALAKEGADIVVAARRTELIEETAREVSALGRRGAGYPHRRYRFPAGQSADRANPVGDGPD